MLWGLHRLAPPCYVKDRRRWRMSSDYREPPGKQVARLGILARGFSLLKPSHIPTGRYTFLAGPRPGDARIFDGYGIPSQQQLGAECDPGVAAQARQWTIAPIYEGEIRNILATHLSAPAQGLVLDGCGPITGAFTELVTDVVERHSAPDCFLVVGFLCGRDAGVWEDRDLVAPQWWPLAYIASRLTRHA